MTKKKLVRRVIIKNINADELDGNLRKTIRYLTDTLEKAEKKYVDVYLEDTTCLDSPTSWQLVGMRPETDKEYQKRIIKDKKKKVQEASPDYYDDILLMKKLAEKYGFIISKGPNIL